MEEFSTAYTTASSIWRRGGVIRIFSCLDTQIATYPLDFLNYGGDNTWRYIYYTLSLLLVIDDEHPGAICANNGIPVELDIVPSAGDYHFVEQGKKSEVRFARGPEYFNMLVAPSGIEGSTASSDASRSPPDQYTFRELLIARDSTCLISKSYPSECDAAHIVPTCRPDVYEDLIGPQNNMYGPEAGLFLNTTLHRAYNALRWSLYLKDDVYYVHFFNPSPEHRELHGFAIPLKRFNSLFDPPDPKLIEWHYTQAVKMRIRGFSAGMDARP